MEYIVKWYTLGTSIIFDALLFFLVFVRLVASSTIGESFHTEIDLVLNRDPIATRGQPPGMYLRPK